MGTPIGGGSRAERHERYQEAFVIVGWSASAGDRPFAAILLGRRDRGKIRYAGRVDTGFSQADLASLPRRFKALARPEPTVEEDLPRTVTRGVQWLKPELVAEIAFSERGEDGIVRHGRFVGLIPERRGRVPNRERLPAFPAQTERGVAARLTHPDKVLYPQANLTKRDVADYLQVVADRMLPHLVNRPVSLLRCPDGQMSQCFFQRHVGAGMTEAFRRVVIADTGGKPAEYVYLADLQGVLAAAQFDVLEFHVWGVHVDLIDRPDRIVFDLDPDPTVGFPLVREAAERMRAALDTHGLASFAMLTGGKGVHVVVPIARRHDWPAVKQFAKAVAERFAAEAPDRFVATMSKAKRHGRIFIDYFRNDHAASAIAPYSPRARANAAVAWPVTWDELARTASADAISLMTARERLGEADPWQGYATTKQSLNTANLHALAVPD